MLKEATVRVVMIAQLKFEQNSAAQLVTSEELRQLGELKRTRSRSGTTMFIPGLGVEVNPHT